CQLALRRQGKETQTLLSSLLRHRIRNRLQRVGVEVHAYEQIQTVTIRGNGVATEPDVRVAHLGVVVADLGLVGHANFLHVAHHDLGEDQLRIGIGSAGYAHPLGDLIGNFRTRLSKKFNQFHVVPSPRLSTIAPNSEATSGITSRSSAYLARWTAAGTFPLTSLGESGRTSL